MTLVWYAPQASCKIGDALSSVSDSETLWAQVSGTEFTGTVKEVRIRNIPSQDVDALNTFDGQLFDESRPDLVEATFTLVHQQTDWFELAGMSTATGPSGYTRYKGTDTTGTKTKKAIAIQYTDGTNEWTVLLNNAVVTSREISHAADGHCEETVTVKCLLTDYYEEEK